MRDTNTRKEISLPYKLRPRSPKFRKKGSGNNKTGRTSCTLFHHIRKKTDLRKKGVNGGPVKGDTFHFSSIRDTFPWCTLPDSLLFVSGESWGSGVTCRVPWHANGWIRGTLPARFIYVRCEDTSLRIDWRRKGTLERNLEKSRLRCLTHRFCTAKSRFIEIYFQSFTSCNSPFIALVTNHPPFHVCTMYVYTIYYEVINISPFIINLPDAGPPVQIHSLVRRHFYISRSA